MKATWGEIIELYNACIQDHGKQWGGPDWQDPNEGLHLPGAHLYQILGLVPSWPRSNRQKYKQLEFELDKEEPKF